MFSASTVTPARSPRSNGERPSGSVCAKKPRSRMSALNARATPASPSSAERASQPAAARSWFTSVSTWPSALGSGADAGEGAGTDSLVSGAGDDGDDGAVVSSVVAGADDGEDSAVEVS